MCTVLLAVDPGGRWPLLLLGTRDEVSSRSWDPPGRWWPRRPDVIAGRDREAGGTWLAVDGARPALAVVLNRTERIPVPTDGFTTRGSLPLAALDSLDRGGADPTVTADGLDHPRWRTCQPFNLVTATPDGAHWVRWDGLDLTSHRIPPGVHLIGNHDLDEDADPTVHRWLPRLRDADRPAPGGDGSADDRWAPWLALLRHSAGTLAAEREDALVRRVPYDSRLFATLMITGVALRRGAAVFDTAALPDPGQLPPHLDWEQHLP